MLHVPFCVKGWHTSRGMESVGWCGYILCCGVWFCLGFVGFEVFFFLGGGRYYFYLCKSDTGCLKFPWTFLHCCGINCRLIHTAVEEIFLFASSHQIQILLLHTMYCMNIHCIYTHKYEGFTSYLSLLLQSLSPPSLLSQYFSLLHLGTLCIFCTWHLLCIPCVRHCFTPAALTHTISLSLNKFLVADVFILSAVTQGTCLHAANTLQLTLRNCSPQSSLICGIQKVLVLSCTCNIQFCSLPSKPLVSRCILSRW